MVPTAGTPMWLLRSQGRSAVLAARVLPVLFNTITFQVVYAAMSYFALSACQMDVTIDLAALGAASRDDDGNGKSVFQVRAL